jgi:transposase
MLVFSSAQMTRLAALCTRLPVQAVAEMAKLSWDTVARVDKRAIELALGDPKDGLKGLRWIGVDEVSRTGGHVYFTIVTNLKSGKVVWIGDGKGEKGLLPFLEALGDKGRRRIQGAVSDLGYQAVLAEQLPAAVHVLDRFHIIQWMNEALNQLRRRLFSGAPQDELGRSFKVKKWLLLSARERLRHRDKLLLAKLMSLNEPLFKGYLLKEQLRGILQYPWRYLGVLRKRLEEWLEAAKTAGLEEIRRVAERLAPHVEAVIAGHRHKIKLGLVEAINSKIAALRVQARGYRHKESFKRKRPLYPGRAGEVHLRDLGEGGLDVLGGNRPGPGEGGGMEGVVSEEVDLARDSAGGLGECFEGSRLAEGDFGAGMAEAVGEVGGEPVAGQGRQVVADDDSLGEGLVDGHGEPSP